MMEEENLKTGKEEILKKRDLFSIALILVVILLIIDILLRVAPFTISPDKTPKNQISAVGYHQNFEDGSSYYIYTIFESNGDVYQCWWDGKEWNQKKVTNYKGKTIAKED